MSDQYHSDKGGALIDEIAGWLVDQSLGKINLEDLSGQFFNRLYAAGIPISRGHIAFDTLHPLFSAVSLEWKRGRGIETNYHPHVTAKKSEDWLASPFFALMDNDLTHLRRHLTGDEALLDFPILIEFEKTGGTDYLAYKVPFGDKSNEGGIIGSWLCDRPGGFTDREITALLRLQKRLGVAYKIGVREQISENIVNAYLGKNAGGRVLNGSIRRGDGEEIYSVIWFCDLRSSVSLANSMSSAEYLTLLNEFLECMAGAVLDGGGEVLRYIGDAALAIFPIDETENSNICASNSCKMAMNAAKDAIKRVEVMNNNREAEGLQTIDFGIGLHVGNVMYGNIGSPERIEFTVVGPAANMAARVEAQCKTQNKTPLISSDFADNYPGELQSVGFHFLAGIDNEQELFTLPTK